MRALGDHDKGRVDMAGDAPAPAHGSESRPDDPWRRALDPPAELMHNADPWRRAVDPPPDLVHSTVDAWQRAEDPPSDLTHSSDPWRRAQDPLLDPVRKPAG